MEPMKGGHVALWGRRPPNWPVMWPCRVCVKDRQAENSHLSLHLDALLFACLELPSVCLCPFICIWSFIFTSVAGPNPLASLENLIRAASSFSSVPPASHFSFYCVYTDSTDVSRNPFLKPLEVSWGLLTLYCHWVAWIWIGMWIFLPCDVEWSES